MTTPSEVLKELLDKKENDLVNRGAESAANDKAIIKALGNIPSAFVPTLSKNDSVIFGRPPISSSEDPSILAIEIPFAFLKLGGFDLQKYLEAKWYIAVEDKKISDFKV